MKVKVKKESGIISAIITFIDYDPIRDKEEIEDIKSKIKEVTKSHTHIIGIKVRKNSDMIVYL